MGTQITVDLLARCMPAGAHRALLFVAPLQAAADRFGLSDNPRRLAMFLGQCAQESGELRWLREIWGPTLAQREYEGRTDLGNTEPGDGYQFRGGGLIQVTGRDMFARVSQALYGDDRLVQDPDLLGQPEAACLSAAWVFAVEKNLAGPADAGDVQTCTRRINGGLNGLSHREVYFEAFCAAFGTTTQD